MVKKKKKKKRRKKGGGGGEKKKKKKSLLARNLGLEREKKGVKINCTNESNHPTLLLSPLPPPPSHRGGAFLLSKNQK